MISLLLYQNKNKIDEFYKLYAEAKGNIKKAIDQTDFQSELTAGDLMDQLECVHKFFQQEIQALNLKFAGYIIQRLDSTDVLRRDFKIFQKFLKDLTWARNIPLSFEIEEKARFE